MQVFIVGSVFYTAQSMDIKRFNKQIIECRQILDAIKGKSQAWKNHPIVLSYKNHIAWLEYYLECLLCYKENNLIDARYYSRLASKIKPEFHTKEYITNMKKRLYTKDSIHYRNWSRFGKSNINMYYADGKWLKYDNGKLIRE